MLKIKLLYESNTFTGTSFSAAAEFYFAPSPKSKHRTEAHVTTYPSAAPVVDCANKYRGQSIYYCNVMEG